MNDADHSPAPEYDEIARYAKARSAAHNASTVAFVVVAFAGIWLALMLSVVGGHDSDQAQPGATWGWEAELTPLVIRSDPSIAVPPVVGFALALLGPFLIAVAAIRVRRSLARRPEAVPGALMMLAGAGGIAILPGLMLQMEYAINFADGGFSKFGGGPAPMCGGLLLIVAAYAGVVVLRFGPELRAGPPFGRDG